MISVCRAVQVREKLRKKSLLRRPLLFDKSPLVPRCDWHAQMDLHTLSNLFATTLSPDPNVRKSAELQIRKVHICSSVSRITRLSKELCLRLLGNQA